MDTGKNLYSEDKYADLYSVIWDHISTPVNKAGETYFTGDISTDIINATKRNRNFPKYIKNREFIDKYRKYEERKDDFLLSDEIPDDKNHAEDIDKVSNINSLLDSISDPLENQIARLRVIDGLPIRTIAEKVKVSKSTVHRIIKKLNIPS